MEGLTLECLPSSSSKDSPSMQRAVKPNAAETRSARKAATWSETTQSSYKSNEENLFGGNHATAAAVFRRHDRDRNEQPTCSIGDDAGF